MWTSLSAIQFKVVMGVPELISGFISTPGKVFSYVQENILKTPRNRKRGREDSTDGGEQGPRVAHLKLSPL